MNSRTEYVLDLTALIAVMQLDPRHQRVAELLEESAITAVNLAETVQKFVQRGSPTDEIRGSLAESHGLSLGDRACLTLAKHLHATAVTPTEQGGASLP